MWLLLMSVERVFHGKARGRLLTHLALGSRPAVSSEIRFAIAKLRGHLMRGALLLRRLMLLMLLLLLGHSHHVLIWSLGIGRCSHEIHQELCVAVISHHTLVRTTRALARSSLVLSNKVLQQLIGSCLRLRPGREDLLHVLWRRSAHAVAWSASILLERVGGRNGALLGLMGGLRLAGGRKR
jgi:hypothetical protein